MRPSWLCLYVSNKWRSVILYYYYTHHFADLWILSGTTPMSKRQWEAVASAGLYANLHLAPYW